MGLLQILGLIFLVFIMITMAWAGISAAPWVPLRKTDVTRLLSKANLKPDETFYDLGAGDGRLIIAAAKNYKANSVGIEISLLIFMYGWVKIVLSGVNKRARMVYGNLYNQDLSQADVVCTFLMPKAMKKLATKFEAELQPGSRVITYVFKVPGWKAVDVDKPKGKVSIYTYHIPEAWEDQNTTL